jgi:acylphosphatase
MADKRLRVRIQGRVQGVWFRDSTRSQAVPLGLTGWVRNLPDGRVEAVFEGPEEKLKQILAWCHQGSSASRVDKVEAEWGEAGGEFTDFKITF